MCHLALLFALAVLAPEAEDRVELTKLSYDQFRARIETPEPGVKLTLVDAWATYCPPCKENFPHLVEMHHKYGDKGLRVMSLSMDDPLEADDVKEAAAFLRAKKAVFGNFLIDGDPGDVFDKLDLVAIPAVFVYGPDGKELKRFTLDDPDNQFTYEEVEDYVRKALAVDSE